MADVKKLSFRERVDMYMDNYTKHQLAIMLAARDETDKEKEDKKQSPTLPISPTYPVPNVWVDRNHRCKTWEDCTNPQYDCINCPMRSIPPQPKYILTGGERTGQKPDTFTYTTTSSDHTTASLDQQDKQS